MREAPVLQRGTPQAGARSRRGLDRERIMSCIFGTAGAVSLFAIVAAAQTRPRGASRTLALLGQGGARAADAAAAIGNGKLVGQVLAVMVDTGTTVEVFG